MTKYIIVHTLQEYIYSLRFFIALAVVVLVYSVSTVSFIFEFKDLKSSHEELVRAELAKMKEQAEKGATELAIRSKEFIFTPRNNSFISYCNEDIIPNTIRYNFYGIQEFEKAKGKSNPFVLPSETINWQFIIILLFGFLAIIFSYDMISGEKEAKTLALCLSNSISKGRFLISKFIGVMLVLGSLVITGTVISLIILAISPSVAFTSTLAAEIFGFLILSLFIVLVLSSVGMLSSVLVNSSNISLLMGITAWLVFLLVIPNTALLLSNTLFPTEKRESVHERFWAKRMEIEASYPELKWSSHPKKPFYWPHEIRANMQMEFFNLHTKMYHEYCNSLFNQFEKTRKFTWISPLAAADYGTEHLLDGGYPRFQKNWEDIQEYQETLLAFFKEIDANDDESPHWYNPYENYSTTRKSVSFEEIPKFEERTVPIGQRLLNVSLYAGILIVYSILFLIIAFMRFLKYDVR
jgi:ABC-type transport system involved in multi-copper enzyme maturation permease subunit